MLVPAGTLKLLDPAGDCYDLGLLFLPSTDLQFAHLQFARLQFAHWQFVGFSDFGMIGFGFR